jgi:hypothetical protein
VARGGERAREWMERKRGCIAKFKRARAGAAGVVVAVERGGRGRKRRRPRVRGGVSQGRRAGTWNGARVETIGRSVSFLRLPAALF